MRCGVVVFRSYLLPMKTGRDLGLETGSGMTGNNWFAFSPGKCESFLLRSLCFAAAGECEEGRPRCVRVDGTIFYSGAEYNPDGGEQA